MADGISEEFIDNDNLRILKKYDKIGLCSKLHCDQNMELTKRNATWLAN